MKESTKRLNFTLPASLYEKIRREAYLKKTVKGKIIRVALELYLANNK